MTLFSIFQVTVMANQKETFCSNIKEVKFRLKTSHFRSAFNSIYRSLVWPSLLPSSSGNIKPSGHIKIHVGTSESICSQVYVFFWGFLGNRLRLRIPDFELLKRSPLFPMM